MIRVIPLRVRHLRQRQGLTQAELAKRTGFSQGHISRLECTGRGASTEGLLVLAKELGTTLSYLYGEQEPQPAKTNRTVEKLLHDSEAPAGLRELAAGPLAAEFEITEHEWQRLLDLELPPKVRRDDCVALLLALRQAFRE
ncbi:hypothetical protein CKO15_10845 [Halorhodospira abdelmalekii]|uniref:helix-turn-helix domain-containing protein n=1 Tax=Halorhodospira abdelmalekii TaxID=421629 RepID=UPI001904F4A7|nr:helix-turn-helix transcriptional regulator [Halorhodospira abdelmalekii]MBK1735766.1 hypothetical protein [Halorhodospira abdelmalekii]